uniref:C2 domain-containing protein n=1 Tax=Macrostomum lignano TaxID=282301 RepID=A0A1I8IUX4_9PLAT
RGAARHNNIGVQQASQIHIGSLNRIGQHLVYAFPFFADKFRPKQQLGSAECGRIDLQLRPIGQGQQLQIASDIAAGNVGPHDRVLQGEALVDRHSVGDAVAGVQHHPGGAAGGVQGQHRLHRHEQARDAEGFEKNLGRFLAISAAHNAVLHWVANGQQASMLFGFGPDEHVAFEAASHHSDVLWSADEVGEYVLWHLVAGKACFDNAAALCRENSGLGRVLIGLRYQSANSYLEVRIVRGDGIRRSGDGGKPPASTYCSVVFLPDCTESVATATVDSTVGCPRWKGAFQFEKFPKVAGAGASSQRCMQVQVHDPAAGGAAISEATLLLSHWSEEDYERGIRVWKYLNGTQESQRVSSKEGTAFLTLYCRPDKFKLTLNSIEDLNPRHTSGIEPEDFYCRLQAFMQHRGLIKETMVRDCTENTAEAAAWKALTVRLVLSKQHNGQHQEICWVDLGSDVKRVDCRGLYKSVMENPNQPHVISVRMNRPPAPS